MPALSFLHHGKERGLNRGKPKLPLLFCPAPDLFPHAVMQVPLCKCSSEPASGEGKTCFSSPAWVTSGCAKPHGRVTSAPAMLISSIADLWEDVGSAAVPGEGWRAKGSAVAFRPCAFVGKGPAVPHCLSHRSGSASRRVGPNPGKCFLPAASEGRRNRSA